MKTDLDQIHSETRIVNVAMVVPSAHGGHPRYAQEVLTALAVDLDSTVQVCLLSSEDLEARFQGGRYSISKIFPPLKHKDAYSHSLQWVIARVLYYFFIEFRLLKWAFENKSWKIIHFQEPNIVLRWLTLLIIKSVLGRQVVMTVHNVHPHKYPRYFPRALYNFISSKTYACFDRLVVHTDELKDELVRFSSVQDRDVFVAHHGVWTTLDSSVAKATASSRAVLFFGSIRENKGLHLLLAAIPFCKYADCFYIAGKAENHRYYDEEIVPAVQNIRAMGIRIELHDEYIPEEEVASFFAKSAVVALPYVNFAAQSGVLFDAIAYQTPVVVSSAGAIGETVNQLGIGEVLTDLSPNSIASALDRVVMASNQGRYSSALQVAKGYYSWMNHAKVLRQLYLN